jgi:hypothetical protein
MIKLNNYHIRLNKYTIMLYNYNNYSFDIVFNSDDFIIQIEDTSDDNKLYSNIYTFEEIKNINNIFSSIDIIEKLIKYCLDKKEDYVLNITNSKIIKLHFNYINNFIPFELILDIFPIRKDLSTNTEIITLKKKISLLENTINIINVNNFIFNDNLLIPINLSYKYPICLSKINLLNINLFYMADSYSYLINNNTQNSESDFINSLINRLSFNKYKIINYNVNNFNNYNNFKLLQSEYIIFYEINITDDILNNLNNDITKLIFVKCLINVENLNNNNIINIRFYKCTIKNIDGFKIIKTDSHIYFYSTPDNNINKSLFSSLVKFNIVDNYTDSKIVIN